MHEVRARREHGEPQGARVQVEASTEDGEDRVAGGHSEPVAA